MSIKYKGQTIANVGSGSGSAVSSIPTGGIIMWSGADVPEGWALCNGENGTPNLRGRFVLGMSETHEIGETGGAEEVTLTVEQMPFHGHAIPGMLTGSYATQNTGTYPVFPQKNNVNNFGTSYAGGSQPHTNMPPYYVLAYIMKL